MSLGATAEDDLLPLDEKVPAGGPPADELDRILAADKTSASDEPNPMDLVEAPKPTAAPGPAPENIVGRPEFGPPAPQSATDAILAKLPPTTDTGKPAPAAAEPLGADPITVESVEAKRKALEKSKAEDDLLAAADARDAALTFQKHTNDAIDYGNAQLAKARGLHDDALAKYNGMQIRDYYDNPTHSRFVSAIAIALGGLGAALSAAGGGSGENHVLAQINKKIDDDYQRQKAQIEKARDSVLMARTGIQDAKEAKSAALEDASARWVASKGAIEQETRQQLAERGMAAADIDSDARVLQTAANKRKAEIEAAERQKKDAMEDARMHLMQSQAAMHDAHAAGTGGFAKKPKGGGGGSGGGGSGSHAETLLQQKIEEYKAANGGSMPSQGQIYAWADDKSINLPHTAKAGHPSVANVLAAAGKMTSTDAAGRRADLADDKTFLANAKEFEQQNNTAGVIKARQKFAEARTLLKAGNGMGAMAALMEADGAARGAQATESSMRAMEAHSGGTWDKFKGWVAKGESGNFGDAQRKNIAEMIDAGMNGLDETSGEISSRFKDRFGDDERTKKHLAGMFGGGGAKKAPVNAQLSQAQAWLDDPKNAASPLRGAVQAKVDAMKGASP